MATRAAASAAKKSRTSAKSASVRRVGPAKATATKRATKTAASETAAAKKRVTKPRPARASKVEGNVVTPAVWDVARATDELAQVLGGVTALARALGVSPSQPSRWRSGKESPGPDAARKLIDLHHVVARAQLVWHPSVVPTWLTSSNGHLNGQVPLGVLMTRGPSEVLDALDATDSGAFA